MRAAIKTGPLESEAKLLDVSGNSSTGNCTFLPYWSMGICHSLEDVTPALIARCPRGTKKSKFWLFLHSV